jgi:hypothetical protein
MRKNLMMALLMLGVSAAPVLADTVPVIDGVFNASDNWGAPVETLNLTNPGGNVTIQAYWTTDATTVYGAFVADTSSAGWASRPGNFANIYAYTGTMYDAGGVGDGNDVVIQTNTDWINADDNLTNPFAGTTANVFSTTPDPGTTSTYTVNGVTVGWTGGNSNVIEFSISKSILGAFPDYKLGVQGWSYDIDPSQWTYQSADAVSGGSAPATPLPASAMSGGAALALLGLGHWFRSRKVAC